MPGVLKLLMVFRAMSRISMVSLRSGWLGSRCVMNEMTAVSSFTARAVSWGLLDSHSVLPRLYRASAVLMFFFPDFFPGSLPQLLGGFRNIHVFLPTPTASHLRRSRGSEKAHAKRRRKRGEREKGRKKAPQAHLTHPCKVSRRDSGFLKSSEVRWMRAVLRESAIVIVRHSVVTTSQSGSVAVWYLSFTN